MSRSFRNYVMLWVAASLFSANAGQCAERRSGVVDVRIKSATPIILRVHHYVDRQGQHRRLDEKGKPSDWLFVKSPEFSTWTLLFADNEIRASEIRYDIITRLGVTEFTAGEDSINESGRLTLLVNNNTVPRFDGPLPVPRSLFEQHASIVYMLTLADSIDDAERIHWMYMLPSLSDSEVEALRAILLNETRQLAAVGAYDKYSPPREFELVEDAAFPVYASAFVLAVEQFASRRYPIILQHLRLDSSFDERARIDLLCLLPQLSAKEVEKMRDALTRRNQ
jgi:hypothetical protein